MSTEKSAGDGESIIRIPPYYYIHVLDQVTNVTRVETGPKTFYRQDSERVVVGPNQMVIVPPRHYCTISNPVVVDKDGNVVCDKYGQIKLVHGEQEIRLEQDPFPLHPGETLHLKVTKLSIINTNQAIRVRALRDFEDGEIKRVAGDEWLFEGPGTYIPRKEVEVLSTVESIVIHPNEALKLETARDTLDREGKKRVVGEQWLVRKIGAYLPGAHEKIVDVIRAYVLTEKTAVHVKALTTFKDQSDTLRKNGEEWLVKYSDMETYIPDVYEKVLGVVNITVLTNRQYCIILNPVGADKKPQLGHRKLIKGEKSFFLQPGESFEDGIRGVYVLGDNEGLILSALQAFKDTSINPSVDRVAGDRWMILGTTEYVPPVEVEVVTVRVAIPLHENEGIYVRNSKTGHVRSVIGKTYMLTHEEELWKKVLPPRVRELLDSKLDARADRGFLSKKVATTEVNVQSIKDPNDIADDVKVVTYQVPHNAVVQVFDYKSKTSRAVYGPDLVMLGPDEAFTRLSLSAGQPKKANGIQTLALLLGPDFCTDIIIVETADHARLSLQLSYNWYFDIPEKTQAAATSLFSVPDFIGDACKAIASRIRGAVAGVRFDDFHKSSAEVIQTAVFGVDEHTKMKEKLIFPQNNLVITSVDIQSVEPVDQRTRDALQKSVQLAIEITINSQEASAKHEAQRLEQEAKGRLETQKILDSSNSEKARKGLLELQANSAAVESCGQASAEAKSRAESSKIEGESALLQAKMKADANKIETQAELERLTLARESELKYLIEQNAIEVKKSKELSQIEIEKFKEMMNALGTDTLKTIATSGMDQQVRLLEALGLKSTLITDGRSPINLINTASGLLGI